MAIMRDFAWFGQLNIFKSTIIYMSLSHSLCSYIPSFCFLIPTFHHSAPPSFTKSTKEQTESSFSIEIVAISIYYVQRCWSWTCVNISMLLYDAMEVPSVSNGWRFWPQKLFSVDPELSKNLIWYVLVGQTQTRTREPMRFAGYGLTCRFQSPVLCFGVFYLLSHLDTLLLISKD